jgi:ABC-type transport system involved in cytochrome c biogenesis permease component
VGLAALLLVLSWIGASDTTEVAAQVRWLNVGVVGILVLGAATAAMTMAGRQAVGRRRQRLLPDLSAPLAFPTAVPGAADRIVAVPRMRRYHVASCPLVAGKAARGATVAEHRRSGLEPCGICQPDEIVGRARA